MGKPKQNQVESHSEDAKEDMLLAVEQISAFSIIIINSMRINISFFFCWRDFKHLTSSAS
uniref:Amino acid transporter family protein n=1 Tax=Rhizophora mucronata TaxID=61149 RepID=A0A2P2KSJ7_RHIMU